MAFFTFFLLVDGFLLAFFFGFFLFLDDGSSFEAASRSTLAPTDFEMSFSPFFATFATVARESGCCVIVGMTFFFTCLIECFMTLGAKALTRVGIPRRTFDIKPFPLN